jgi:hypothetical protein
MLVISIFEFPTIKDFYRMNSLRLFFFENFQFFSVSNWVHLILCHSKCVYRNVKIFSQWLWEMLCYTTIKKFWLRLQPFYVRLRTFWLTDTFWYHILDRLDLSYKRFWSRLPTNTFKPRLQKNFKPRPPNFQRFISWS